MGIILVLASVMPHVAWMFDTFEPEDGVDFLGVAWRLAFAFEVTTAFLVHKSSEYANAQKGVRRGTEEELVSYLYRQVESTWKKLTNPYFFGLVLFSFISGLANTAHAYEYQDNTVRIYELYPQLKYLYLIMFGTALPIASILFANILSVVESAEEESINDYKRLSTDYKALRKIHNDLKDSLEKTIQELKDKYKKLEKLALLINGSKADKVKILLQLNPKASNKSVSEFAGCTEGYVYKVKSGESDEK